MAEQVISHALVVPDKNFDAWLNVIKPYMQAFERVAVIRSPAGNDLNRYRNVTAVQAPATWMNNDALQHVRRIYPMVVRVDVIPAKTPDELSLILQERIRNKDRYGEKSNTPPHIHDRFVLEWPTDARPGRITRPFSTPTDKNPDTHEGIEIAAPPGSRVYAGASGKVASVSTQPTALGYGQYVQISTQLGGQNFLVTYGYLQNITVKSGQEVKAGDTIADARADGNGSIKIVVQNPPNGVSGFPLPSVVDPAPMIYWQGVRLRPTDNGLRIRSLPNTDGEIVAQVGKTDWLEPLEIHGRLLAKVGVQDQWVKVRLGDGREGYTAAWLVEAREKENLVKPFPGVNVTGMNLDMYHPLGRPDPKFFGRLGWVRMKFNVSYNPDNNTYGNTDINAAYSRYRPLYEAYGKGGRKMMVVLTHQLYGEGAGYTWNQMDANRWAEYIPRYADFANRTARMFAGQDIIHVYQIWNEQDTRPEEARAAVPVPPDQYAKLLAQTIQAIRAVDSKAVIITGGHVRGAGDGMAYAKAAIGMMPASVRPDGIAFHAYGLGPASSPYSIFGRLETAIERYGDIMPTKPVWITEWGVLDRQDFDETNEVAAYAKGFLDTIKSKYSDRVAAAIWYAYAKGMDNGYGLVDRAGRPLQPLYDYYMQV